MHTPFARYIVLTAFAALFADKYPWNNGTQITIPRGRLATPVTDVVTVPLLVTLNGHVFVRGHVGGTAGVFLFDTGAPLAFAVASRVPIVVTSRRLFARRPVALILQRCLLYVWPL